MSRIKRASYDVMEDYISNVLSEHRSDGGDVRSRIVRELLCGGLTQRQREYLILRYQKKLSGSEIARMYGVHRSAVCITLARARKRMAAMLGTQKLREDMYDYLEHQ